MHKPNRVIEKLKKNEPVLVGSPTPFADPRLNEMIGMVGYDCIWIDWEHQDMHDHDIFNLCLGARASGAEPMVRIRKGAYWQYFRPLEMGATGLMVPHVTTADEAKLIVRNTKYAPMGLRGMDGIEAPNAYGMGDMKAYMKWANEQTFVCIQIEDKEALPNIEAILAVDGIDGIFVGPADLTQSMGIPLEFTSPKITAVFDTVAKAAKNTGKWWGAPSGSAERMSELLDMGARFLAWGAAVLMLTTGYRDVKRQWDETLAARNAK